MKNLISIVALLVFSNLQLLASNVPNKSTLNVFQSEKLIVLTNSINQGEAKSFTIIDYKNEVVFNQDLNKNRNVTKYDLTKLPTGQYKIKVTGEDFIEFHDAEISKESLRLNNFKTYYRPTLKEMDNKILVEAFLQNEKIDVIIYDHLGNLVYDFKEQQAGQFTKAFNLKELNHGKYSFVVITDHFTESSNISI